MTLGTVLAACTTLRKAEAPRTATQQLLISTAAERSAEQLALDLPPDTKVHVDSQYFEGLDSKYAVGAIRDRSGSPRSPCSRSKKRRASPKWR